MNKTIGFIPFMLDEIRRPQELYIKFFGEDNGQKAENLYGTEKGLMAYCQNGVIGLKAMEPKGMEKYLLKAEMPSYNKKDEDKLLTFRTYQIWILAMLNNQDYWEKSETFAKELLDFANSDKKISKQRTNLVENVLAANSKKSFISALTDIVKIAENINAIKEIAKEVNIMPTDNVPYFLTLVRFQYASINK